VMRSRRVPTSIGLLALLAGAGCAKGTEIDSGGLSFGVGSASVSAGPSTASSASETGDDTSMATSSAEVGGENCGNGAIDAPEECDGPDLDEQSCATQGFSGGQLSCTGNCTFDTSMCSDACGNGAVDMGEDCDGDALGSGDCASEGYAGGTIDCNADCTYDTSGCADAVCGDAMLQDGETCDCGMRGSACTPAQLGNLSCTALPAPSGGNYSGGTLACTPTTCTLDESGCTACGNGIVDMGETCDGAQLGGQTCVSQGFDAGNLACSATCQYNTGACVDWVCGNGSCEPNEDSCACPSDCPDDPNTCGVPCECGGFGGACYCDAACLDFGDCCPNGPC
jgi:hypothetical protein